MASTLHTTLARLQIPLEDVLNATNNFHDDNIIGHGGLGIAYKGQLLRSGNLIKISALRLDSKHGEGDVEFWTEISMLHDLNHPNIVSIVGFCDEKDEKVIITKYAAKGSLEKHLDNPNLTWTQRLKISVGVARALSYLQHDEGRGYGVIHLNINTSSILLDENWEPKLSGFKVSLKQSVNRMDRVFLCEPVGAIGYVDPEIVKIKGVTHKSDNYSFGVVLFELLCGRIAYIKNEENRFLAKLAQYHYKNETLQEIIHPSLKNQMSPYSLKIYSKTAYSCLEEDGADRQNILIVVDKLEKALTQALKFKPDFGNNLEHLNIRLNDIKLATNNFSDEYEYSSSGYFTWYKVELDHFDNEYAFSIYWKSISKLIKRHNRLVLIKRFLPIDDEEGEGEEEELFFTELEVLTSVKHRNIINLLGFCVEGSNLVLVTEESSEGLYNYLTNVKKMCTLSWENRLKISIDVAHALNYIHFEMEDKKVIIHSNIDCFKIAFDDNWEAEVEYFERAVFLPPNQKDEVVYMKTYFDSQYHVDPEYMKAGKLKRESDVYSFGVVLFEIVCGRYAGDQIYLKESEKGLVDVARRNYSTGTLENMIDPTLKEETGHMSSISNRRTNKNSLQTFLKVANQCVIETQDQRPTMKVVLKELQKALFFHVQIPAASRRHPSSYFLKVEGVQKLDKNQVVKELETTTEILEKKFQYLKISLADVSSATNDFSETYIIASWDGYILYRAEVNHFNKDKDNSLSRKGMNIEHPNVVIKRYPSGIEWYSVKEFYTEIEMLSSVKHPNIVNLLGFCLEDSEMILVTENVSNGHLYNYLEKINDMRILTWEKRLRICIDVAHALEYLHFEMEDQKMIVHCDINTRSIMLDENLGAKIVDFWWSIFLPPNQEDEALDHNGFGRSNYIDPEYDRTCMLKRESDVYSFGVVLFEILCGRLAHDPIYYKESDKGLVSVARRYFGSGTLEDMIDPILNEETNENGFVLNIGPNKDSLNTFIEIAHQCVAETQGARPTMRVVVNELKKALLFQEKKFDYFKISLADIKSATNEFSEACRVASWDGNTLYRAELNHFDKDNSLSRKESNTEHSKVFIKRYGSGIKWYGVKEFYTEIESLRSVNHPNIVSLLGICIEDSEMILVTENVSNGFLDDYLEKIVDMRILTWEKRLSICIDVAQALKYLHYGMEDQKVIIHCDINSRSIVLDENSRAKIVDFWWSVFLPPNQEDGALYHNGFRRKAYEDPEYESSHMLKRESDVYSFGVILFEILCGRSAIDQIYTKENDKGLAFVARRCYCSGTIHDIIDPIIKEEAGENNFLLNRGPNKDSLHTFIEIAHQCVAETQDQRPTMKMVVNELQKALVLQQSKKDNPKISLEDIKVATQNFHKYNCIGGGGFGGVFKGKLQDGNGVKIIVAKRLDTKLGQGEQQFWNELQILLEYKHENVIGLIGYCDEKDEKVIVYEYAPKRSLDRYLKDASLTWVKRLIICIDVATALYFLHGGVGKQAKVIHRDIKTANILLNNEWKAKLGDFGLSLISPITHKTEYVIGYACGTPGYVDPLYEKSRFLTIESDIYSFGVVLFEILCGRSTFEIHKHKGHYLPEFIRNIFEKRLHEEVVFEQIREQIEPKSLAIFQEIAYQCLHHEREKRPTTKMVLTQLKKALEIQTMAATITKFAPLQIPLEVVAEATNNFHHDNIIEHGGFSTTYKGRLLHSGRLMKIAAQRFDCKHVEADLEFLRKISTLFDLKHKNLISVVGFCDGKDEKVLVTMYEANGSLGQYLNNPNLTWAQRLRLCLGVARALSYLHYDEERDYAIIHCNINSDTILLDENWEAKLSGFEIAIKPVYKKDQVSLFEQIGNKGCMDPAIVKMGGVTYKSDIYSFGVVLFEILCGRRAFIQNEANKFLAPLAKYHYETGTLQDLVHPDLWNQMSTKSLFKYSRAAYSCLMEECSDRPDMHDIVCTLEKALESQLYNGINLEHLKIRLSDIKLATDNFSETYKIASQYSCSLYRAYLEHFDKENPSSIDGKNTRKHPKRSSTVVIKRYPYGHKLYTEEAFFREIEMLSSVKHPNIVTLLGFCVEGSEMILFTENFSNGYLVDYLGNVERVGNFTWEKRLKICIDVARALNYLHSEMEDQKVIINRDITSYGIGLDENLGAKITDFWFSVFLPPNQQDESLYLLWIGKTCYIDPEYEKTDMLKRESDVYGFGVVLFEILCGRIADDPIYKKESDKGLAYVARRIYRSGTLQDIIDPIIKDGTDENSFVLNRGPNKDSLHTFVEIAHQCVAETQDQRPMMKVVVKELEKTLFLQENNKDNPRIPLEDIKMATQNFHDDSCIDGEGEGFEKLYKGNLQDGDEFQTIVAKRLDIRFDQREKQFLNELQILWEYKHGNVIGLLGYCDEQDEKIIVYEYASRRSLDRYLNNASLTWMKRLNICIDVASALYFIHGGVGKQTKVIHGDIKTASILLNHDWKAKLADFGRSLLSPITHETTYAIDYECGTPGYVDPLYEKSRSLTVESDIYSFGVVLFEVLCGRSTIAVHEHEGFYLPEFIGNRFKEGKHDEVVFELIREQVEPKSLATFQEIAYQCLNHERHQRPTTKRVLTQLKKSLEIQNMASAVAKFAHLQIPLEDVVKATNNFHHDNIIGHCGFSTAYKGQLSWSGSLMKITARRFDCKRGEAYLKFLREISVLLDLKHTNLISIVGFCDEKDEKIIVTMYEANKSLGRYLSNPNLTWTQRLRICLGVARALRYLHYAKGNDYTIIHCNINSDTMLLDENWEAKLSGFEFSIKQSAYNKDQVCLCEDIGTMGCVDPAIEKTGGVTHKSDIYSFGVVLFEILCGRKSFIENDTNRFLAPLARHHYAEKTLQEILFPGLWDQMSPGSFKKYSHVAYSCLNEDQANRPTMHYIVSELSKALELQLRHESIEKKLKHLRIHLSDIKFATDSFSETYKIVSWYTLYRAELEHFDKEIPSSIEGKNESEHLKRRSTVVIKRYPSGHKFFTNEAFFTEIEILSSVKHPNIVNLLGFCVEDSEMILVTENVSNGFLFDYLKNVNGMRILTWEKRLKICIDVAHALRYLHFRMGDQKIIHRDINCTSIVLDENYRAKIADFWWSVLVPPNQEDKTLNFNWIGRFSCTDPEYKKDKKLKRESDVYSFGVVLFEILCGRISFDPIYKKESDTGMAYVARRSFNTGTIEDMIDPLLKEETGENNCFLNKGPNTESMRTFIEIAYQCVAETQDQRPTMKVVAEKLEKALFFHENNKVNLRIPLEEIKLATQNFHDDNCIGEGRFGKIYKGNLQDGDELKTIVAKRLDTRHGLGEKQFLSELQVLWKHKHENITGLVGYCDELEEKIIVYEHASRRSLDKCLNDSSITWVKRLNICINVASALDFLHGGVGKQTKVIHGDIKTANVLLNHDWKAKLAGFGLSLISPITQEIEYVIDYECGTPGYLDPVSKKSGFLTMESDIYSFGVVLFEILCGRSTFAIHEHEGHYLPEFIRNRFEEGKHAEVVFEQIREQIAPESLTTFKKIAYQCLHVEREKRPTAKQVLMQLKMALEFQVLANPKVNDQSVINVEETISADYIDPPNPDTDESNKFLDVSERQKKEVEDYVHAYRSPAKEVFMNWTSRQREYFVVLCRELQINPEDMDDEHEVAS